MIEKRRFLVRHGTILTLAALLAGCGTVEDPPWLRNKPSTSAQMASGPIPASIEVQRGETLYGIARRYGLPMKSIIAVNRLEPPYKLLAGQRLALPRSAAGGGTPQSSPSSPPPSAVASATTASPSSGVGSSAPVGQLAGQQQDSTTSPPSSSSAPPPIPTPSPVAPHDTPAAAGEANVASTPPEASASEPPTARAATPPTPPPRSGKALAWPVKGNVIARFGPAGDGRRNDGINIAVAEGTPIKAAENGVVVYAGNELRGFGNMLLVKHDGGWMTAYAHNSELTVQRGASVKRGQVIAKAGSTGNVSSPQLHFEVRKGSKAVDPLDYLDQDVAQN